MRTILVATAIALAACVFGGQNAQAQDSEIQELREQLKALEEKLERLEEQQKQQQEQQRDEQVEEIEIETDRPEGALDVYWKDGLRFESAETAESGKKPFQLKFGGRLQNDWAFFNTDSALSAAATAPEDGTEFRRARIAIGGKIYENFEFMTQYDFAGGDVDFADVWFAANGVPYVGTIKIGHFKEPASLEELGSDNYTTFMERALPNIFAPSRNMGVAFKSTALDDRMTYAAGVFKDADGFGNGFGSDNYAFTGRVSGLPYYQDNGRKLLHLGAWATIRNMYDAGFSYRQRPEAHLAPFYLNTGSFAADNVTAYGLEAAGVWGPASLQTEYMASSVDLTTGGDAYFYGYYLQGSYFLTGEHRPYKTSTGTFDRIRPKKNFQFGPKRGWGAWEAALRYSYLDLDDAGIQGGEQWDITAGLNWYLNPNMRWMINYVHGEIDRDDLGVEGGFNAYMTRLQVTW